MYSVGINERDRKRIDFIRKELTIFIIFIL